MALYSRIVVPVDFGDPSHAALSHACDLARRFDSELHLVHVVEPYPLPTSRGADFYPDYETFQQRQRKDAESAIALLPPPELRPKTVIRKVLDGDPADVIVDYAAAHGADLVVLGTHGRHGLSRWLLGSVTERVVRHAHCPVLVVRLPKAAKAA